VLNVTSGNADIQQTVQLGNCFRGKNCRNGEFLLNVSAEMCAARHGKSILIAGTCINC